MTLRFSLRCALALALALVLVFAVATARAQSPQPPQASPPLDSIDQRAQVCTPCHGKEGRATNDGYYPRIAGKPAGYLYNQLINFRDGRRHFPMMAYLTARQRDDYLRELAAYFASQHPPYPPPKRESGDNASFERGRVLASDGDAQHDIPACSSCHGRRLLGVAPAVPGLLGLSRDYLIGQLGSWRNGTRRALAPDCMSQIVQRLSQADLVAVTTWLASQAVPVDSAPEQAFERQPALMCGSIERTGTAP